MNHTLYNHYVKKMVFWRTWEAYLVWAIILLVPLMSWMKAPTSLYLPVYVLLIGFTVICNDYRIHYRKVAKRVYEDS